MTCWRLGTRVRASSMTCLAATTRPRRSEPSTVMTALALASLRRVTTASAPNPENSGSTIAPILGIASSATAASGMLGR